jgi:hypothetical protein
MQLRHATDTCGTQWVLAWNALWRSNLKWKCGGCHRKGTFKLQVGGAIKGRALAVLLIARVFTASRNSLRPVYLTVHHQITT